MALGNPFRAHMHAGVGPTPELTCPHPSRHVGPADPRGPGIQLLLRPHLFLSLWPWKPLFLFHPPAVTVSVQIGISFWQTRLCRLGCFIFCLLLVFFFFCSEVETVVAFVFHCQDYHQGLAVTPTVTACWAGAPKIRMDRRNFDGSNDGAERGFQDGVKS